MSEIIEAIADMMQVIADNPASILIVLGFMSTLLAVFIPMGAGAQIFLGFLGSIMLITGIIAHFLWLKN
jgi:hypothetical protein